jgi:hypothetical protein
VVDEDAADEDELPHAPPVRGVVDDPHAYNRAR